MDGLLQSAWLTIRDDLCKGDTFLVAYVFSYFVLVFTFLSLSGLLFLVDVTGFPKFLLRFKIQDDFKWDWLKFKSALKRALFNVFVMTPICYYFVYKILIWRGCHISRELPNWKEVARDMFFNLVMVEISFYYLHRLMHYGSLYKKFHKAHHEYTQSFGIVAIACHPVEFIIVNIPSLTLGVFVCGSHVTVIWLWYIISIVNTVFDHSGYHLPFIHSAEFHDYHHLKFNQCYGVFGILDWLHGTDGGFRETTQFKRHFTFFNLIPIKVQIP